MQKKLIKKVCLMLFFWALLPNVFSALAEQNNDGEESAITVQGKLSRKISDNGGMVIFGRVKNNSADLLQSVEIVFDFIDPMGMILETVTVSVKGKMEGILEGGEDGNFLVKSSVPISAINSYKYTIKWQASDFEAKEKDNEENAVTVVGGIVPKSDTKGNMVILGQVKNNTDDLLHSVEIIFEFLNSDKKVMMTVTAPVLGKLEGILEGEENGNFFVASNLPILVVGSYKYSIKWKTSVLEDKDKDSEEDSVSLLGDIIPKTDEKGNMIISGNVRNNTDDLLHSVEIIFDFLDSGEKVLTTVTAPVKGKIEGALEGGENGSFFVKSEVPVSSVRSYKHSVRYKSF
jgi:hypothetical protein